MPTEIEATYRVVTPLFCAGADPQRAELRLPSFKGALRFWWRALAWSRMDGDLGTIRQREYCLFGSADRGQSRVSMRLEPVHVPEALRKGEVLFISKAGRSVVGDGARYLGYGVMEAFASKNRGTKAGELTRSCLPSPFEFTVRMRIRDRSRNEQDLKREVVSLENALVCLGTHGGMGAKSRKGYGSLAIRSLCVDGEQRWHVPQTIDELRNALAKFQSNHNAAGQPEYTALSRETRCLLVSSDKKEALKLLDLVGRELVRYRSWGHRGKIFGKEDSEKNFEDDHDLMKGHRPQTHPRRIAFGLPHNYGRQSDQQVGPKELDRRASPLFIHVHECGASPVVVLSFLPARFLPKDQSDILVGRHTVRQTPETDLYRPIQDFLNRLLDRRRCREPLKAVEVLP